VIEEGKAAADPPHALGAGRCARAAVMRCWGAAAADLEMIKEMKKIATAAKKVIYVKAQLTTIAVTNMAMVNMTTRGSLLGEVHMEEAEALYPPEDCTQWFGAPYQHLKQHRMPLYLLSRAP
jgi:hypothetical protein